MNSRTDDASPQEPRRPVGGRRLGKWLVAPAIVLAVVAAVVVSGVSSADRNQQPVLAAGGRDRDHDGLSDASERRHRTNPRRKDTDRDGLWDGAEVHRYHTNPRRKDTDRDGLWDGAEVHRYHTNPRERDTDGDGLSDGAEVHRYHTNPRKRDTDGDGFSDLAEIRAGTNPRDRASHPPGSPAAAPAPSRGCRLPAYPDASCTGVPAGTALTPYTGPTVITAANTVIDSKVIHSCITVSAPGVVIKNSQITVEGGCTGDVVMSADGGYSGARLTIEDSEIACTQRGVGTANSGTALGEANVNAYRLNIYGCENGLDVNQEFDIEDSFIHDLYQDSTPTAQSADGTHTDGIQIPGRNNNQGALGVTIKHNTIFSMKSGSPAPDPTQGDWTTSAIISDPNNDSDILIQANLLAGGAYTLYCSRGSVSTNYRVLDNHFTTRFKSTVGWYGVSSDCGNKTQSGNVIHETGKAITLS